MALKLLYVGKKVKKKKEKVKKKSDVG